MKDSNLHSDKGFRYAMVTLGIFFGVSALEVISHITGIRLAPVEGLLLFGIFITAAIGSICTFKGIREPNSARKIAAMVLNSACCCFLLYIVVDIALVLLGS
jgi:hypothetical protein